MVYSVSHHQNGETFFDPSEKTKAIYNPAQGQAIGTVSIASQKSCQKTVAVAKKAWNAWSQTSLIKRSKVFFKFKDLLEKNEQELAQMVTREHGKTIDDAKGSIARAIEVVEMNCGLLARFQGQFTAEISAGIDCYTMRQSLGVCAGVSPFNFPIMVPVWMMIPAIACGNTFILKPSEQAPSAPLRLLELLDDAGLPPGVANCLQGDKNTVDYLLAHPDISAFTAVASTAVAESIYTKATANGKRAHTFGGAKNHCLVMPDADLPQAANAIVGAAFGSAGERCMAISVVVIVGDETADQLIGHLSNLIHAIRVDAGDSPNSDMGPLISAMHRQRVLKAIDDGVSEGASLLIDGRAFQHPQYPDAYFVGPTLFDKVQESMSIYQNEIFGPVLVLMRVAHFEEGLALVNRHQYGNGSAIFTRDGYTAREYSHRAQVGMVGINIPIPVPVASHPFGGWKRSSFGDTNMHGMESFHFYTRLKTITSKWPETALRQSPFTMPTNG